MGKEVLIPFLCHSSPGFEQRHCVHWTVETYSLVIRCYTIDSDLGEGGEGRGSLLSGLDEANPEMQKLVGNSKGPRYMSFWSLSVNLMDTEVLVILCRADLMSELTAKVEGAAEP